MTTLLAFDRDAERRSPLYREWLRQFYAQLEHLQSSVILGEEPSATRDRGRVLQKAIFNNGHASQLWHSQVAFWDFYKDIVGDYDYFSIEGPDGKTALVQAKCRPVVINRFPRSASSARYERHLAARAIRRIWSKTFRTATRTTLVDFDDFVSTLRESLKAGVRREAKLRMVCRGAQSNVAIVTRSTHDWVLSHAILTGISPPKAVIVSQGDRTVNLLTAFKGETDVAFPRRSFETNLRDSLGFSVTRRGRRTRSPTGEPLCRGANLVRRRRLRRGVRPCEWPIRRPSTWPVVSHV
jgi:hypothetical protein